MESRLANWANTPNLGKYKPKEEDKFVSGRGEWPEVFLTWSKFLFILVSKKNIHILTIQR